MSRGPVFLAVVFFISSFYSTLRAKATTDSLFLFSTVAHHRRSGQVFTQDQEEMILIGAFGLFWFGRSRSHLPVIGIFRTLPFRMSPEKGLTSGTADRHPGAKPAALSSYLPGGANWGRGRTAQEFARVSSQDYDSSSLTLFIAFLVAWRAVRQRWSFEGEMGLGGGGIGGLPNTPRRQPGFTGNARGRGGYKPSWPCSPYDVDCVVEEWSYY
jgi:hypothetical protein